MPASSVSGSSPLNRSHPSGIKSPSVSGLFGSVELTPPLYSVMLTSPSKSELVNQKLEKRMNYAVDAVVAKKRELEETEDADTGRAENIDYHTAAMVVALERLLLTLTERGIWPQE